MATILPQTIPDARALYGEDRYADLLHLSRLYERAQAERDKMFLAHQAEAEQIAAGKVDALREAVQAVAHLDEPAEAIALLDLLEGA